MNLERFCLKFFTQPESYVDDGLLIEIFHEWIRLKKLGGILLDVADYRHVPEGPGVMLITHEINFALDYSADRFGLLAQRKLGNGLTQQERILELVQATVAFGTLLETDSRLGGQLRFEAGNFHFMSNDRLLAANSDETLPYLLPDLEAAGAVIYAGQPVSITRVQNDLRDRLTVKVDTGQSINLSALLEPAGLVVA